MGAFFISYLYTIKMLHSAWFISYLHTGGMLFNGLCICCYALLSTMRKQMDKHGVEMDLLICNGLSAYTRIGLYFSKQRLILMIVFCLTVMVCPLKFWKWLVSCSYYFRFGKWLFEKIKCYVYFSPPFNLRIGQDSFL